MKCRRDVSESARRYSETSLLGLGPAGHPNDDFKTEFKTEKQRI
jgi:hypothetical protein